MVCLCIASLAVTAALACLALSNDSSVEVGLVVTVTDGGVTQRYKTGILIPFEGLSSLPQLCHRIHIDHGTSFALEADIDRKSSAPNLPVKYRRMVETMLAYCPYERQKDKRNEGRRKQKKFTKIAV
mgnify:CR=1 FL=1